MKNIDVYIINVLIIIFPLLINNFYFANKKNSMNRDKHNNFISFYIMISLIYLIRFNKVFYSEFFYVFLTFPLLLSLLYHREKTSYIICIIIIETLLNTYNVHSLIIILLFFCYYILYKKYIIEDNSIAVFIKKFELITIIYLNIELIIEYNLNINYNIVLKLIEVNILYLSTGIFLNLTFLNSNKIINNFMLLKDFEKEKRIKDSLFKLTHEIKNPLAVINGYLQMFDVNDKKKSKKYITIMKQELNRTLNLLTDFMQYSKIKIVKSEFMLIDLFNDIKNVIVPIFKENKIKYSYQIEDNIILNADYDRLKQVIINLIKNSVEACVGRSNSIIDIVAYKNNNKLFIIVKDNGIGMDKETLDKIKVPFYTTKANGTGLGVSLSKEIIEAHSGVLNYTSIQDKKTIAKIILPI